MKLRNVALAFLFVLVVAGCGDSPTPTQVATAVPTAPTSTPGAKVTNPTFNFMPRRGGPGTIVNIAGGNFKAGTKVILRIGTPQPVGEPLATADVQSDGRWNMSVTIPGTLPSGKPIESAGQGDVQLVAMDDANNVIASEPFGFVVAGTAAKSSPVAGDPAQPVRDFLNSLKTDPTGQAGAKYLGEGLKAQISGGSTIAALLGIDAVPTDLTIGETTPGSNPNSAEIAATLTVNGNKVDRSFAVIHALNVWTIEAVSQ